MITKLPKFVQGLKKDKKYNKYLFYSQIIRNERTKRKLTLAEIAKGICSVSYLCKFEKNDIIADESYIRAIFKRINIDFDLVGKNILVDGIERALKAYLASDYEALELLFHEIDDSIFNAQNDLVKCFYFLTSKKYEEFKETIETLDNIKDTLLYEDVGVFFFLVIQYYIDTHQYFEANKILDEIEALTFTKEEVTWLLLEQKFTVSFYIKNYPKMYYYYGEIKKIDNVAYPAIRKLLIRAKVLYSLSEGDLYKAYDEFTHMNLVNFQEKYQNEFRYWQLATYIKGGMYIKGFDEIYDNKLYYDPRFLCLLLLAAYRIKEEYYINLACTAAKDYHFDSDYPYENTFIKLMLLYFRGNQKHEYIDYLKEKILPNNQYIHFLYTPFYTEIYVDYLKKCSRYKEVVNILLDSKNLYRK